MEKKDISSNYHKLEKCCGEFFDEKEKIYFFPLIASWAGSDRQAVSWFQNEKIPALGGKTGLEICRNNQMNDFLHYIRQIEYGGFS
ncbi:hypothetical protein ESZ36_12625 [Colwellia demingiae]|uniref:DUF2384 domain-containing protein n=1 Tax=Colwellia demingiae TaxID=89401 RepID=A0A5C6QDQ5_9GAMM|nr:hypothetical protein [Colwellia demingiae]TWX67156.1 hypothetical protein ESZ36_12625 [Colwellia demingiae]